MLRVLWIFRNFFLLKKDEVKRITMSLNKNTRNNRKRMLSSHDIKPSKEMSWTQMSNVSPYLSWFEKCLIYT